MTKLLDISLADGNGFAVCSAIKSNYNIPVMTAAVIALVTVLISAWVPSKRATRVPAAEPADVDCILALGCFVYENGRPRETLRFRWGCLSFLGKKRNDRGLLR